MSSGVGTNGTPAIATRSITTFCASRKPSGINERSAMNFFATSALFVVLEYLENQVKFVEQDFNSRKDLVLKAYGSEVFIWELDSIVNAGLQNVRSGRRVLCKNRARIR
jgi:hypothetical protein